MENKQNVKNTNFSLTDLTEGLVSSKAIQKSKSSGSSGVLTVVNATVSTRVGISVDAYNAIGKPKNISVAFNPALKVVLIGEKLPIDGNSFTVRRGAEGTAKPTIYAKQLVDEMLDFFDLDFTDITSISFGSYEVVDFSDSKILVVKK